MSDLLKPVRTHVIGGETKPKRRRRKRSTTVDRRRDEEREQKRFVAWARAAGLEIQHQNNGSKSRTRRIHLHQMGCTAGAADLLIFDRLPLDLESRGLALEFKSSRGKQSVDQISWEGRITELGWRYHVVRSAEEAVEIVTRWGLGS